MDKSELVRLIYDRRKTTATMKDLAVVVDEIFSVIGESLKRGEAVDIAHFGTFDLKDAAVKSLERFGGTNCCFSARTEPTGCLIFTEN